MTFLSLVAAVLLEQWRPLRTGNPAKQHARSLARHELPKFKQKSCLSLL